MKGEQGSSVDSTRNDKFDRLRPIQIDNVGTVARDHLASERTWLTYVQTSLAIASIGVAITQLFAIKPIDAKDEANPFEAELDQAPLQTRTNQSRTESTRFNNPRNFSRPMGTMLIIFGIIVLLHGMLRFVQIQTALLDGKFPLLSRITLFTSTVILALFFITCFVLILISQ